MNKKLLVVIDPGHVGPRYNPGAVKGYYESQAVWDLSQYEKAALEAYGIDVVITKKTIHDDIGLYDRGQMAVKNAAGYTHIVFESNHTNAANNKACGVEVIYSAHLPKSKNLADKIASAVVSVMQPATGITYNRGAYTRQNNSNTADWYGVIRGAVSGAKTPAQAAKGPVQYAYIVEHGFHDNKTECQFLYNKNNLKKIAEAKAKIIAEYFNCSLNGLQAASLKNTSYEKIITKIGKLFTADQAAGGVLASVSLAQFLLESAYGQSELAQKANNCFGMKKNLSGNTWCNSAWDGTSVYSKETKEYVGGKYETITTEFRKYDCIEQSIADHSAYLVNAKNGSQLRYAGLKGCTNYRKAFTIIKNGGYATSPDYVENLCKVVEKWDLTRYDLQTNTSDNIQQAKTCLKVDGLWGKQTTRRLQILFGTTADSIVSNQSSRYKAKNKGLTTGWDWKSSPNGQGSELIRAIQRRIDLPSDSCRGEIDTATIKAMQKYWHTTVDGYISKPSQLVSAIQKWANEQD